MQTGDARRISSRTALYDHAGEKLGTYDREKTRKLMTRPDVIVIGTRKRITGLRFAGPDRRGPAALGLTPQTAGGNAAPARELLERPGRLAYRPHPVVVAEVFLQRCRRTVKCKKIPDLTIPTGAFPFCGTASIPHTWPLGYPRSGLFTICCPHAGTQFRIYRFPEFFKTARV